jgi:hypothetical protein
MVPARRPLHGETSAVVGVTPLDRIQTVSLECDSERAIADRDM